MNNAESAFVEALSELEVVARAAKSKLHPCITELCRLAETYMREIKELKLAMLKDVEDEIADNAAPLRLQWEIDPFTCYTKA